MSIKIFSRALLFSALLLAMPVIASAAGHIAPHGVTNLGASQLIAWYDESQTFNDSGTENNNFQGFSYFQVTNGSNDTGVNIHVQIFADNVDDVDERCREHDFNDTLTPADTVVYILRDLDRDGLASTDPGGNNAGNPIAISVDETRGFIVVTAVDTVTLPRQAVSHNYLFAKMITYSCNDDCDEIGDRIEMTHDFNAMGRLAVDFVTGAPTPDGVLLDGITNGLRVLQPSLFFFSFNEEITGDEEASVVSIAFSDTYSDPSGEYRAEPATAVWDPLIYDQFENATSCQQHTQACFQNIGLHDDIESYTDDDGGYLDIRLCPAFSPSGRDDSGWVEIAVSGLSGLDNNVGVIGINEFSRWEATADWMHSE